MPLELHIYGPAFSLPSIDAQCLAATAYLTQAVPRGEWVLVASAEAGLSPTKELPALRNENVWIGGFRNIVDYVRQYSGGRWCLDAELEGTKRADCVAFSAFIEARGQPLLDLSLYVSTQNYTAVTRPLYSSLQPFPLPYFTPSSIRSAAKARTARLGLSSLDIDSSPPAQKESDKIIPPSLRKPEPLTLSSLLSATPETTAQIRLDALATDFFTPLQALRGKNRFFVAAHPTSLDCLALAYLSLALLPDLPSPWLATCLRQKYPQLCAFVHDLQRSWFGGSVSLEDAFLSSPSVEGDPLMTTAEREMNEERRKRAKGKAGLPWVEPGWGRLAALGRVLRDEVMDSVPVLSQLRYATRLRKALEAEAEDEDERAEVMELVGGVRREVWVTSAAVVAGVGALVGYMLWYGVLGGFFGGGEGVGDGDGKAGKGGHHEWGRDGRSGDDPESESGKGADGLAGFGEAGAALGVLLDVDGAGSGSGSRTGTGAGASGGIEVEVQDHTTQ